MRIFVICILFVQCCFGLSQEEIVEIASKDNSRENLIDELQIFPEARLYEVTYNVLHPAEAKEPEGIEVAEKVVEGKYLVSDFTIHGGVRVIIVVEYSPATNSYIKWVVSEDKKNEVQEFRGIALGQSISWLRVDQHARESGIETMMLDNHFEDRTEWLEQYYRDGELLFALRGFAKRTQ